MEFLRAYGHALMSFVQHDHGSWNFFYARGHGHIGFCIGGDGKFVGIRLDLVVFKLKKKKRRKKMIVGERALKKQRNKFKSTNF